MYARVGIVILLLALLAYSLLRGDDTQVAESSPRAVKVRVHVVKPVEYTDSLTLTGDALANESVRLRAQTSDIVAAIHFTEGATVKKGERLVTVENKQEYAQIRAAKAVLNDARNSYKRVKGLAAKQAVSTAALDEARASLEVAKTLLATAQVALGDRVITAPFAGILGTRNVSVGTLLQPDMLIATIDDISIIKLDLDVPERYLAFVKAGQRFSATTIAYPDIIFEGVTRVVESRIDPLSRKVKVRGDIANQDGRLKPGMLLNIRVEAAPHTVLAIPEEALVSVAKKHFVYVVDEHTHAQKRAVQIGRRFDGLVEITEGINVDASVVTEGQLKLRDGQLVQLKD